MEEETKKKFKKFYKKNYKKFLILPFCLMLFSIIMISSTQKKESFPIYRDISLKGGLYASIDYEKEIQIQDIEKTLKQNFPDFSFQVSKIISNSKQKGFVVDTDLEEEKLKQELEKILNINLEEGKNYTSNYIDSSLSKTFVKQAVIILLVSFLLMSIIVFLYFRKPIFSFAVVLSAVFDLIVTIGILNFFKVKISIAGIGALIMLIGYSIDTDILLTNRVLKEKEDDIFKKIFESFKTGSLMTLTTLSAGISAFIFSNSSVIKEISLIMVLGLSIDFISTWLQNAGIILTKLNKK